MNVYLLQHTRNIEEDVFEIKTIGVYSSTDEAKNATKRLVACIGFKDYPDGFSIEEYLLDSDSWTDGFMIS